MSEVEQGLAVPDERSAREILTDIAQRLPRYAQLAARLAQDTRLASNQRAPLSGLLGSSFPVAKFLPGVLPMIGRVHGLIGMVSTVSFALSQLEPEVAEQHLLAVGLSRAQVEADLRDTKMLAGKVAAPIAGQASELLAGPAAQQASRLVDNLRQDGVRRAGRLVGRGLRAVRQRTAQSLPPPDAEPDAE